MIHDRIPSEHRAVRQMQRAWDYPKIAGCPDSGCACYSLKSQYPQIVMSLLFESGDIFSSPILKKRQRNVRCIAKNVDECVRVIDECVFDQMIADYAMDEHDFALVSGLER